MNRGAYDRLVAFQRSTVTTNEYGESIPGTPATFEEGWARVRFGTAQEKREAAQEAAGQSATFELVPTTALLAVLLTDHILFDGSQWDIVEKAPLERNNIRFTATRSI